MSVPYLLFAYKSLPLGMDIRIKKRASADTQTGIDRGSWLVFRAFKQVPKSTLISALKKKLRREYNHLGWSVCVALRLAITGFFDP